MYEASSRSSGETDIFAGSCCLELPEPAKMDVQVIFALKKRIAIRRTEVIPIQKNSRPDEACSRPRKLSGSVFGLLGEEAADCKGSPAGSSVPAAGPFFIFFRPQKSIEYASLASRGTLARPRGRAFYYSDSGCRV
jgi:hypothetical protein